MKKRYKIKLKILSFLSLLSICLMTLFSGKTYAYTYNPDYINLHSQYGLFYYVTEIEFSCKRLINNTNYTYNSTLVNYELISNGVIDSTQTRMSFYDLAITGISKSIGYNNAIQVRDIYQYCYDFTFWINFSNSPNYFPIWALNMLTDSDTLPLGEIDSDMGTYYFDNYSYNYFDFQYINSWISNNLVDTYIDNNLNYVQFELMDLGTYESLHYLYMFSTYAQCMDYCSTMNDTALEQGFNVTINQLKNEITSLNVQITQKNNTIEAQARQIRDLQEYSAPQLIWTIASTPFDSFKQIWNVDLLGLNIANFAIGLLSALIFIYILKKVL